MYLGEVAEDRVAHHVERNYYVAPQRGTAGIVKEGPRDVFQIDLHALRHLCLDRVERDKQADQLEQLLLGGEEVAEGVDDQSIAHHGHRLHYMRVVPHYDVDAELCEVLRYLRLRFGRGDDVFLYSRERRTALSPRSKVRLFANDARFG